MTESKKKICFYSIMSSGHLNVCSSIGSVLLDKYSDKIEVYFIADTEWREKLTKIDPRFKICHFEYDDEDTRYKVEKVVKKFEESLKFSIMEKLIFCWKVWLEEEGIFEIDIKAEKLLKELKPDLCIREIMIKFFSCTVLSDQGFHLPSMVKSGIPYGFVCSCNPLFLAVDDALPKIGYDCYVNDKEKIELYRTTFDELMAESTKKIHKMHEERDSKFEKIVSIINRPVSDLFTIYSFPNEIDYYNEETRIQNKLLQLDTPLFEKKIPKPFQLPKEFAELPGKILYVSLGSLFSAYVDKLQRLVDILDKLPYKYIISKGPNGDKLKFPSNKFIGENYVNQLAVLQVADAMIAHGGNNTFCETFYFGVPCIILPIMFDQINNAIRIEETGFGYRLDIMNYTEEQLIDRVEKILNDEQLKSKWKQASERIQKDDRMSMVVNKLIDYLYQK